ncbi:hypothetical protein JR316_0010056 [Psilocybe cubensis]|uniref:Uncharacterized protein n=2 Tax=Psilocybe cubensis TaxID=181762 RepID=A0A8H8CGG0_PSICU|nr:hypothetical protein JR316_0010056 [Psilocybe cubensis]KAH9477824.1 hypothetical protein JR316_0010056 [Psilocybe cubensis]
MKLFAAIVSLAPAVYASLPGSTFGITYNTTSSLIPPTGHLALFNPASSPDAFTTISPTTPDLGAFFTVAGVSAVLHESCNINALAALVPPSPPIEGLKYALQWTTAVSDLPSGSIETGFQLGPSPTFDTLINTNVGPGFWGVSKLTDSDTYVVLKVGWSEDETAIPVTLVKAGTEFINC